MKRLKEKRAVYKPLIKEKIPQFIDKLRNEISHSATRNEQMWPDWTDVSHYPDYSYEECVEEMKNAFLVQLDWLDEQISTY